MVQDMNTKQEIVTAELPKEKICIAALFAFPLVVGNQKWG